MAIAVKVQTVIVNYTQQDLVLLVGTHDCFTEVAKIVPRGGEHKIELTERTKNSCWSQASQLNVPRILAGACLEIWHVNFLNLLSY